VRVGVRGSLAVTVNRLILGFRRLGTATVLMPAAMHTPHRQRAQHKEPEEEKKTDRDPAA
jgi:hypothetical protein